MISTGTAALGNRQRTALPFVLIGSGCVIAGGLVAAATAHAPSEHGTWAVAYLVLVAGIAQCALGIGQALLATYPPRQQTLIYEVLAWNFANAGVILGTLLGLEWLTDIGGILLIVALIQFLGVTRGAAASWWLRAYQLLIVIVLVSAPIGLVLAYLQG